MDNLIQHMLPTYEVGPDPVTEATGDTWQHWLVLSRDASNSRELKDQPDLLIPKQVI